MIIRNRKISNLTVKDLLSKIDSLSVYKLYMPSTFLVGKVTYSPFRRERNPSFIISMKGGDLHHFDFADSRYKGNCIDFVMQLFSITLPEAIKKIAFDFGVSDTGVFIKRTDITEVPHEETIIQVVTKKFTSLELGYWNSYHIDISELREENIFSISDIYINKEKKHCPKEMVFGYLYGDYWKIYKPVEEKKRKWISNVPITYLDGDLSTASGNVILTKSKKDKVVLKKFLPSCSTQNESLAAFSEKSVSLLKKLNTYVAFDSDEVGVRTSLEVTSKFGFSHVNVPYMYLLEGIKDFSDLAKGHGLDTVKEHLKLKGII